MRIDPLHNLAVKFQDEAQNPMCRWVLGPEIDCEGPAWSVDHSGLDCKANLTITGEVPAAFSRIETKAGVARIFANSPRR